MVRLVALALFVLLSVSAQLQTGTLPNRWNTASGNCKEPAEWTVHQYNASFFILRQSGCSHYEKPFLYLLFGRDKALLLDTGAGSPGIAVVLEPLLNEHPKSKVVAIHLHGHADHTAGDTELRKLPRIEVIAPTVDQLKEAFGIEAWPDQTGSIDLGGRILDAVPIPGHDPVSVALYDRQTGILFSGDTLYPGRLYVADWPAFRSSIDRLADFTASRPVAHILGSHIEQSRTPFVDYPVGTRHQPDEHSLELSKAHLLELQDALRKAAANTRVSLRDFTVVPKPPRGQTTAQNPW